MQNINWGKQTDGIGVKASRSQLFDVEMFLATVDGGRTLSNYRKNQKVFSQSEPTDLFFYIQEDKVAPRWDV